ncbi:MAG: hypothetical protein ACPL0C_06105 [Candidatus Bathyarchaeales archaeon]
MKTKLSFIAAIAIILASTMLGRYGISFVCAYTANTDANPKIVYWLSPLIYEMNGRTFLFTRTPEPYYIMWSPSGRMLLLVTAEREVWSDFETKVVVINASNMELIHKFSASGSIFDRIQSSFAISSDETKIFFGNISSDRNYVEIISVNLDGTNPTLITRFPITEGMSHYTITDVAGDGTFLVYTEKYSFYDSEEHRTRLFSRIKKFDFSTGETTLILEFEGSILSLKVAPSNDRIAFTSSKDNYGYGYGYGRLYIVNLDGTNLIEVPAVSEGSVALWVNWASNDTLTYTEVSEKILWSGDPYDWAPTANMTAIRTDGSNKHVVYNGLCGSQSPANSSLIVFLQFSEAGGIKFLPCLLNLNLPITPNPDSDGDGLSDNEELQNFLNPCDPTDLHKDYDDDGLTNLEEINYGTYLGNPDFDGDGLSDGVEVKVFKTNPRKADTDGDGVADGLEAAATGLNAFISVLPEGWIRMTLEWKDNRMYVSTNSSVLGVVFDSENMALSISVGGPDGSTGIANISIPVNMINALSNVKVTLDDQPVDFQISQVGNYAQIYVQYHHSYHELTAHLSGGVGGSGGIGGIDLTGILSYWWLILSVGIVAAASVITAIIIKRG